VSVIYRQVADGKPIPFTVTPAPITTPTVALYDDPAKTILHAGAQPVVAGGGTAWTYTIPAAVGLGTYYAVVSATTVAGSVSITDSIIVTAAVIVTGGGLPLATAADFNEFGSFALLIRENPTPGLLDKLMLRASRAVESRCDRRLAPFTVVETQRMEGIDLASNYSSGTPLDLMGALGRSQATAYGTSSTARDFWLREYAPQYADMWAYSNLSVQLTRATGGIEQVLLSGLEGPRRDTGHVRFTLGTYVPPGTNLAITYSGGYQTVPEDLNLATVFQAAKFAIVSAEPQMREGMDTLELDAEILTLLLPYIRS
jgi:hypothetical protein